MKLKILLLEITFDQALKVLNYSKDDLGDEAKLKKAYRDATIKAHPDKGGSTSAMQDVTAAYELLKKTTSSPSSRFDWEKSDKENLDLGLKVLEQLKEKFNTKKFIDHFNQIYSDSFQVKISKERPSPSDRSAWYAGLSAEFFNASRDIVFSIVFHCTIHDVKYDKSLGSGIGNISYPLGVSAYGFFNNKKLKITQRDYSSTRNHDVLIDPELSFPKAKLEKFKTTSVSKVFKRADMILYLTKKLGMTWDGDQARIKDVPKPLAIVFSRGTFMKTPYWSLNLYENSRGVPGMSYLTLPETIETAQAIEILVKAVGKTDDPEQIKKIVKDWAVKMKDKS